MTIGLFCSYIDNESLKPYPKEGTFLKIIICDDEPLAREQIRNYIQTYNQTIPDYELLEFSSGEELVKNCKAHLCADIVFLDIELNNLDGIDTAKLIRIYDKKAIIIFVSSHKERVFDAFDCETFHFITKPFSQEKFDDVLEKALAKYKLQHQYYMIKWRNKSLKMPIEKIKFLEICRRHVVFHTYDGEFQMAATLTDVLNDLAPYGFLQTHQGYVVNMGLIRRIEGLDIMLMDGTKVCISARKRKTVITEYADYISRNK